MTKPNQKSKDGRIAAVVRKKAAAGVPVREIFAAIRNYQNAPQSYTTFYKYYRDDMDEARGIVTEEIANVVVKKAVEGDFKAAELWLTTKGGWSKNTTNTNIDIEGADAGEKSTAMESLMNKLGFGDEEEK